MMSWHANLWAQVDSFGNVIGSFDGNAVRLITAAVLWSEKCVLASNHTRPDGRATITGLAGRPGGPIQPLPVPSGTGSRHTALAKAPEGRHRPGEHGWIRLAEMVRCISMRAPGARATDR